MNTEIEKKWFVYINERHEGPFTVDEISEKKNSGVVSDDSYVWCEGMPDWVLLSKTPELSVAKKKVSVPAPKASKMSPGQRRTVMGVCLVSGVAVGTVLGLAGLSQFASDSLHAKLRPTLTKVSDTFPFLSGLFKLVPNLSDVKHEELMDLEDARQGSPENGVKIAVALSQNDPNRPFFYVSTNLPDKTKFDLYLVGIGETLLNRLQYSSEGSAKTNQGFGRTDVFLADGGQLIPKGEYQIFVVESNEQDETIRGTLAQLPDSRVKTKLPQGIPANSHFLITKTYFVGGEKDEVYLTRLKSFHEKIKQNSEREATELRQYADTLGMQFKTMSTEFGRLYNAKKPSPVAVAVWKKDAELWQQINSQLDQTIQTWSTETLQNEFFYGKVYQQVKSTYETLKSLFTLENGYVSQPIERSAFDIQHGKALSEANEAVSLLQTKLDLVSKAPKSAGGLPTREGL